LTNKHQFTGSVEITNSLSVVGQIYGTSSYAITASYALNGGSGASGPIFTASAILFTGSITNVSLYVSGSGDVVFTGTNNGDILVLSDSSNVGDPLFRVDDGGVTLFQVYQGGNAYLSGSLTASLNGTASYAITASHATDTKQIGYLYALHTSSQAISATNTWQELLFERNQNISDWTHIVNTGRFTSSLSATYHIKVSTNLQKTAGTSGSAAIRMLYGNDEITGSYSSYAFASNFSPQEIVSEAFIYIPSGSGFKTQVAATTTDFNVTPSIAVGSAATYPSAKIFITRV